MKVDAPSAALAADCRIHYLPYIQFMHYHRTGRPFIAAPHHEEVADALQKVVTGKIKRLIINISPRWGKTDFVVRGFGSWCEGNWTDSEFMNTSYGAELATANSYDVRAWMQHEAYAHIFGAPIFVKDAVGSFRTSTGGVFYSGGSNGALTGFGFGKKQDTFGGAGLIDDPIKPIEANSRIIRESVNRWYGNTFESRRNSPDSPIIVCMQRLHVNDLSGFLLNGGSGETWHHIKIPALNERDETNWPAVPTEELHRLRNANPAMFAAQYMQNPIIPGGNIVKGEWFGKYSALPPQLEYRFMTADTAMKTGDANDYSVFTLWGVKRPNIYGLDQLRGKWEAPDLRTQAAAFWRKHITADKTVMGALRAIHIEDKASGTGLIQDFKKDYGIPVVPIERADKKDRYARLSDVLHYLSGGRVLFPNPRPAWALYTIAEHEAFTPDDSHDHDDTIDTVIDAINIALAQTSAVDLWKNPALFR